MLCLDDSVSLICSFNIPLNKNKLYNILDDKGVYLMLYAYMLYKHYVYKNIVVIIPLKTDTAHLIAHNNISNAITVKSLPLYEFMLY